MSLETSESLLNDQIESACQKVTNFLDHANQLFATSQSAVGIQDEWSAASAGLRAAALELARQKDELSTARSALEATLRASQVKYNVLFDSFPLGITVSDQNGAILETNQEAVRLLGLSREEHLQRSIDSPQWRIIQPDGAPMLPDEYASVRALQENRRVENVEMGIVKPDEEVTWISVTAAPLPPENSGLVVTYSDITDRKRTEDALRESEARYRTLVEMAPFGIIVHQEGEFVYANAAALCLYGADTFVELQTKKVLDLVHPADRPLVQARFQYAESTGTTPLQEIRILRMDGEVVPVESTGVSIVHQGKPAFQVILRDIREQKQVIETLQQSEEKYRTLFETIPVGVVYQDADGRIFSANPAAEKIVGLTVDQMQGRTSMDPRWKSIREDGSDYPGEDHPIVRARQTGARVSNEVIGTFNPADGKIRWTNVSAVPLFKPGEIKPNQVYAVFLDISERKRAEDALRESEQRYRSLFEGMTEGFALHDIIRDENGAPCDYRFLEINPAFERLTGLKRADVIGKLHSEVLPGDNPNWIKIYGKVALTGEPIQFENYSPALKRHYEVFAFCPAPGQFAVLFVDITERVGAEAELRSVNERLNSILSSITDAYVVFDSEWRFVEINPVAEKMLFRRPAGELLGRVFMEVYPQILDAEFYRQHLATLAEDQPVHFETYVGERIGWFEVHAYPRAGRIEIYLRDISERKQAEEQIASLARFPQENPNPVLRINREGKLLYANVASRLLDKRGLQVNELVPAFWRDLVVKTLTMGCEQQVQYNTGEIIYSITACPIVDASYVNLYGRDITELVKVTQALQASRDELELRVQERTEELKVANAVLQVEVAERLRAEESLHLANAYTRSLIEASLDPLVTITPDGKVGDVNTATEVVTGFSRQELIGTDFHYYFTDPEKARFGYQQVFETGTVRDYELQIRHKDGHITQVLYNASIFHDEGGEIKGVFAAARDITERMRIQQNLVEDRKRLLEVSQAEREQRLFAEALARATLALNSSLDLEHILDNLLEQIQGVIPFHSANIGLIEGKLILITRRRGYESSPETVRLLQNSHPISIEAVPIWQAVIKSRQVFLISDTQTRPDWVIVPELAWVRSALIAPLQAGNQVVGLLNLLHDRPDFFDQESVDHISAFANQAALAIQNAHLYQDVENALAKEQAARQQLVQTEKFAAMGRLLGSVAHELNNPLQTIQNCLYLTRLDTPADSPIQEYLDMAFSETSRLSSLVAQLRELYRPRIANTPVHRSLIKILVDVRSLLEPQLHDKHVAWFETHPSADFVVFCVPDQIKQVFINICTNAIEAMQPDGGDIYVKQVLSEDGSQVGVKFQDTGPGISPEGLNNLFEPFYTTKASGLGLGLSISFELVQRHNGRIEVESHINQGTAFTVWLPLANTEQHSV